MDEATRRGYAIAQLLDEYEPLFGEWMGDAQEEYAARGLKLIEELRKVLYGQDPLP